MLENIKKIIPEMEKSDSQSFYNNAVKSQQQVKFSLPKKLVISFASVIILLAICIPVGINMFDSHGGHTPEIIPPGNDGDMSEEVPNYNLQGTTIEFYDCYFGEDSDVLVLYFPDITLIDIYIKEVDIDNKIINVEIKDETKQVTFANGVYTVDVHGLEQAYVSIHFAPGTLEGNKITQDNNVDDEPNVEADSDAEHGVDTDEYHESQTTNITMLTFLCSITMPDGGYEQVTYIKNFDYINDEPLINLRGRANSVQEAMDIVDIERVLVFNDDSRINSIIYDKNNSWTEVIVDYDVNSFITIRTIVQNGATLNEIVERYVDTDLYPLEEEYHSYDSGCTGNLYVCYKNDEGNQSAYAVLEYHENFTSYFFVVLIDLYQEDLQYSFKELLNNMTLIK